MRPPLVIFSFTRQQVEQLEFGKFLSDFRLEELPEGGDLKSMMGTLAPLVAGFDDDPREVYVIPEIRRFWRAFNEQWPYWLFFFLADERIMAPMMYCRLKTLDVLAVDGKDACALRFDKFELANILRADFEPMKQLCDRAAMSEVECRDRAATIFRVFDIPFKPS